MSANSGKPRAESQRRLVQFTICILHFAFCNLPVARAELLIEFEHFAIGANANEPRPIEMRFWTNVGGGALTALGSESVTTEHVGHVFAATSEQLAAFQAALTNTSGQWRSYIWSPGGAVGAGPSELWTMDDASDKDFTRHVPQLGFGMTGYLLTDVTQTIDSLQWVSSGSQVRPWGTQTIRFYGTREPGDYNGNGEVDAADYVQWRNSSGSPIHYTAWRANFGGPTATASGLLAHGSVPEPETCVLFAIAVHFTMLHRPCRPSSPR